MCDRETERVFVSGQAFSLLHTYTHTDRTEDRRAWSGYPAFPGETILCLVYPYTLWFTWTHPLFKLIIRMRGDESVIVA